MTIAPCRALARFRHREKIAAARMARSPIMAHARVKQTWLSRDTGEVVTREWEKAHVAMMGWLGQALAQTRDAWTFITPPPLDDCYRVDRMRGPENYWWHHATGSSWGERK